MEQVEREPNDNFLDYWWEKGPGVHIRRIELFKKKIDNVITHY